VQRAVCTSGHGSPAAGNSLLPAASCQLPAARCLLI